MLVFTMVEGMASASEGARRGSSPLRFTVKTSPLTVVISCPSVRPPDMRLPAKRWYSRSCFKASSSSGVSNSSRFPKLSMVAKSASNAALLGMNAVISSVEKSTLKFTLAMAAIKEVKPLSSALSDMFRVAAKTL